LHQCVAEAFSILGDVEAKERQNSLFCQRGKDIGQNLSVSLSDRSSYGDQNQEWNRRILGLPGGAGISLKAVSVKRKWCLELHATCLIFDIIRQSLALPLMRTGNDGWVPFLECQLTWIHATVLWYSRVSDIALSL